MGTSQPPCVLIVTDEPLLRHMVARLLASEGFGTVTAERGEQDFEGFARIPLALILVNTYLPHLSGAEAVARVRAFFPGVPVLHLEEASSGSLGVDGLMRSVRALTSSERRQVVRTDVAS